MVNSSWIDNVPMLGVGLGFRAPYQSDVFQFRSQIDFLEIVADHFFEPTLHQRKTLGLLKSHFPLVPHGLGLSLGSAEGLAPDYLEHFSRLVKGIAPPYWSEHVSFTKAGGIDIGHLTPVPRTRESLSVLIANVRHARETIGYPLILENITETIRFPGECIEEAEFLTELLESTDSGLLLDVTNLYTNSVNYRFDPLKLLWKLPPHRIVQLHFVGGHWDGELLIDSHSADTPPEVWQLLEEVVRYAPVRGILLERDENLPPIEVLLAELDKARNIWTSSHAQP